MGFWDFFRRKKEKEFLPSLREAIFRLEKAAKLLGEFRSKSKEVKERKKKETMGEREKRFTVGNVESIEGWEEARNEIENALIWIKCARDKVGFLKDFAKSINRREIITTGKRSTLYDSDVFFVDNIEEYFNKSESRIKYVLDGLRFFPAVPLEKIKSRAMDLQKRVSEVIALLTIVKAKTEKFLKERERMEAVEELKRKIV